RLIGMDEAMWWLQNSANRGNPSAQAYLAFTHFFGGVVRRDPLESMVWAILANKCGPSLPRRLLVIFIQSFLSQQNRTAARQKANDWCAIAGPVDLAKSPNSANFSGNTH